MIKLATLRDIPRLIELGKKFKETTPWAEDPLDEELASDWLKAHFNRSDRVVLMGEDGAIGLALAPPSPFGKALYADESFWFAEGRCGLRLLAKAEAWCEARSAILRLSTLSTSPDELVDYLLRRGYFKVQSTWELRR